jgi:hypothetical protein
MLRSSKAAGLALSIAMACSGAAVAQDRGDRYAYDDGAMRIARSTGYNDGSRMAYHDLDHRKPFNPYPRAQFAHADHGYHREYGDKYAYRSEYERGYRAGYSSTYRR